MPKKANGRLCDADDKGVGAKLACVEPSTDVHTNEPDLHSGINLWSVFCSETHGQSGERNNQRVFRCHLFSSQWGIDTNGYHLKILLCKLCKRKIAGSAHNGQRPSHLEAWVIKRFMKPVGQLLKQLKLTITIFGVVIPWNVNLKAV